MRLTSENPGLRWSILLGSWMVAAALIWAHTEARREYVELLDGLGLRGARQPDTPLRQVIPARYSDAHTWVRHALNGEENGAARVRVNTDDNAPHGREVHWSSGFAWLLRGAAALQRAITSEEKNVALERVLLWFNAPLLFALVLLLSAWAARRAGAGAGVLVTFGMLGHPRFYEGFTPAYVDHHGVVTACILGMLLGVMFMGGGWWQPQPPTASGARPWPTTPNEARRAAFVSGLFGAIALWLSAAATLPVIALVGVAGLGVAAWRGRAVAKQGAHFDGACWRWWGRTGALASGACYLIEYAPAHLGWRLEVNHPLYSLAWWGGAECVATLAEWRVRGTEPFRRVVGKLVAPALAVMAVPLTIAVGGAAVFWVKDPFVAKLRHFVAEGMSLPARMRLSGVGSVASDLLSLLVLVPAIIVLTRRRSEVNVVLLMTTAVTAMLVLMSLAEMRWWLNVAAAQICLIVVLFATMKTHATARWSGIVIFAGLLGVAPAVQRVIRNRAENRLSSVAAEDLFEPLYRDIAATLRLSKPEGEIVLLANPNASSGISYYGRFRSIGTLYWENAPGLRAAAEMFSAATEDEARMLIFARGVTHLALISHTNFLGEYFHLLHPGRALEEAKQTFGFRLAAKQISPAWLQPIAFRPPPDLKDAAGTVRLFKVVVEQNEFERLYHTALAQAAEGDYAAAETTLAAALARIPREAGASLCEAAGAAFYDYGADAAAARTFRRGLDYGASPGIANTLAWILATSSDAAVRDGRAALILIEPLVRREQDDPTILSTWAAACAEVGRFADAIAAADRAFKLVRQTGDRATAELLQRRLETYRAGKPWRQ